MPTKRDALTYGSIVCLLYGMLAVSPVPYLIGKADLWSYFLTLIAGIFAYLSIGLMFVDFEQSPQVDASNGLYKNPVVPDYENPVAHLIVWLLGLWVALYWILEISRFPGEPLSFPLTLLLTIWGIVMLIWGGSAVVAQNLHNKTFAKEMEEWERGRPAREAAEQEEQQRREHEKCKESERRKQQAEAEEREKRLDMIPRATRALHVKYSEQAALIAETLPFAQLRDRITTELREEIDSKTLERNWNRIDNDIYVMSSHNRIRNLFAANADLLAGHYSIEMLNRDLNTLVRLHVRSKQLALTPEERTAFEESAQGVTTSIENLISQFRPEYEARRKRTEEEIDERAATMQAMKEQQDREQSAEAKKQQKALAESHHQTHVTAKRMEIRASVIADFKKVGRSINGDEVEVEVELRMGHWIEKNEKDHI